MKRELTLNIYDDIKLDVYFDKENNINELPILCYNFNGNEPLINEIIFLVDESVSMNTYLNGINKWYWAKELVVNQIIRYLGNQVTYSYISSKSNNKLMDNFSYINALNWVTQRNLEDGWDFNQGIYNAHCDTIFNKDAALIVVTDGSLCISDNWIPTEPYVYKYYFFITFDENTKPCNYNYSVIDRNFYWEYTINGTSIFEYDYLLTEEQTNQFIGRFFKKVHDRYFEQIQPGLPNTEYEVKHPRDKYSIFITTDSSGMFSVDDLNLLPSDFDFHLGKYNSFNLVQQCLNYKLPTLPIPDDPDPETIPDTVESIIHSETQYVHFSNTILGGHEIYGQLTKIYNPQTWCKLLGQNFYPYADSILDNISVLNGIAISPYVRFIYYSEPNFNGDILVDITGPAVLNSNLQNRKPFNEYHKDDYISSELQNIYPQSRRAWIRGVDHWKNGSFKILFLDMPSSVYKLDSIVTTYPPIVTTYPPNVNCRVHFSGTFLWENNIEQWTTEIYNPNQYSDLIGAGDYNKISDIIPNSTIHHLDGIAIDYNTRLIIYSKPNFEGDILLDKTGPFLINNIKHKDNPDCPICDNFLTKTFNNTFLQDTYPQSSREWSLTDMNSWVIGSCKILCTENPPYCVEKTDTINEPCLYVGLDISNSMANIDVISDNNNCTRRALVDEIRNIYSLTNVHGVSGSSIEDLIGIIDSGIDNIINNNIDCEIINIIFFTDGEDGGTGHKSSWNIIDSKMNNQDFIINIYIIRIIGTDAKNQQSNIDSQAQYELLGQNKPIYVDKFEFQTISNYDTSMSTDIDDVLFAATLLYFECICPDGEKVNISSRYASNINEATALASQECGG